MKKIIYKITRKILILINYKDLMNFDIEYYRSKGVKIGENARIFSNIITPEPYLLTIGNNVTISTGVNFITHDNSVSKCSEHITDNFGKIFIGDKCFIGLNSIIMPGVYLGNNTIVAAGAVVTKSFINGNVVIGGNPAKIIMTFEEFKNKSIKNSLNTKGMTFEKKREYILNSCKVDYKK